MNKSVHVTSAYFSGDSGQSFSYFIQHSDIICMPSFKSTLLRDAIFVRAKLHSYATSPYTSIQADTYGTPIVELMVKLIIVDPENLAAFEHSVVTQADIYAKSMTMLQPICLGTVFSNIYNWNDEKIDTALQSIIHTSPHLTRRDGALLGVVAMESSPNFISIDELRKQTSSPFIKNFYKRFGGFSQICHLVIELVRLGYNLPCFKLENILVDPSSSAYYDGAPGMWKFIDVGDGYLNPSYTKTARGTFWAKFLGYYNNTSPEDDVKMLKYLYNNFTGYEYLIGVYDIITDDEIAYESDDDDCSYTSNPAPECPGITNAYDAKRINDNIAALVGARSAQIDYWKDFFDINHLQMPQKYPNLPLVSHAPHIRLHELNMLVPI